MKFSAVILAGGASRRMGRDKAWIEVGGVPLLLRAMATVRRAGAAEVFVSGRRGGNYADANCRVLFDANPGQGPLGGIERALSAMSSPLLLVLAVDVPRVTATFLRKLISRCDADMGIIPRSRGELEPLVAVYPKRCLALVHGALSKRQFAARDFVQACLCAGAVREFHLPARDEIRFANWNSPHDLPGSSQHVSTARGGKRLAPRTIDKPKIRDLRGRGKPT